LVGFQTSVWYYYSEPEFRVSNFKVFDINYFKKSKIRQNGRYFTGRYWIQTYVIPPAVDKDTLYATRKCACVIVTTLMIVRCLFWFHWVLYFGRWWVSDECLRHLAHSLFGSVAGQLLWHQHEPQSREGFRLRVECATSTQVNNAQPQSSGIV